MLNLKNIASYYPKQLQAFPRYMLREYLQCKILQIIFNSPPAVKLSFIGGTALRIVHENTRFSEDLDFDNFGISRADFDSLSQWINKELELEGYKVEIKNTYKKAFRCDVRFPKLLFNEKLSGYEEEKILIQIDTTANDLVYKPERIILDKFDIFTHIFVTPLPILLAQKILTAFERNRTQGRDFFDIIFLLPKTQPDYEYLKAKIGIDNPADTKKYILDKSKELDFEKLADDVMPFVFNSADSERIKLFTDYIKTNFK